MYLKLGPLAASFTDSSTQVSIANKKIIKFDGTLSEAMNEALDGKHIVKATEEEYDNYISDNPLPETVTPEVLDEEEAEKKAAKNSYPELDTMEIKELKDWAYDHLSSKLWEENSEAILSYTKQKQLIKFIKSLIP